MLTNKIDGDHRRFSFSVREAEKKDAKAEERIGREDNALLTVRDNIFMHKGKFYMLANHPEGKSWHNYVNSIHMTITYAICIKRVIAINMMYSGRSGHFSTMSFNIEMRHYFFTKHLNKFYFVRTSAVDIDPCEACFEVVLYRSYAILN